MLNSLVSYAFHDASAAKSNVSAALKISGSSAVEALPYPARRLSAQEVQDWSQLPSVSISPGSSVGPLTTEGSMHGGSGPSSARSRTAKKKWRNSPAGLALSTPLLPSDEAGQRQHGVIHEDSMALDTSPKDRSSSSEPSDKSVDRRRSMQREISMDSSRNVGRRAGLERRLSTRTLDSGIVTADVKVKELFAQPLASEGEGSVFPIDLPVAKRRAYEVNFIKQFDRLAINTNAGDFWTIIDANWMNNWIDFVMGNKPSPGPISNYQLYDEKSSLTPKQRKCERRVPLLVQHAVSATAIRGVLASHPHLSIKEGLQKVKDYRVIHPLVWFIFREMYDTDGSPDIFRWRPDVYSAEVLGARKARLVEEVHTKAVYELRRFSARLKDAVSGS
eukprot:jgi/Undpi1/6957/HiC_scaffold_21.g09431.m1